MNIFLALCNECDRVQLEDIKKMRPMDDKISTVDCNSCGNLKTVLMFTVKMPEPPEDDKNLGDKGNAPKLPPPW